MPKQHFYYGNIHLALDSLNGEILAIRNLVTGDNLIKNAMCCDPETYVYQPFTFKIRRNGETTEYHPLYSREPFDSSIFLFDSLTYPVKISIMFTDSIPIVAFIFKILIKVFNIGKSCLILFISNIEHLKKSEIR